MGGEGRLYTTPQFSTRMMAWLHQQNRYGCRYRLTTLPVFEMVGLWKNSGKTVRMLFRPCRVVGTQLEATYKLRVTGGGLVYWAR